MNKKHFPGLLILIPACLLAEIPAQMQFVFPRDRASLISRTAQIILRSGFEVEPSGILAPGFITVSGSKSGGHNGLSRITSDGKTILFRPEIPFSADEEVTILLGSGLEGRRGEKVSPFSFGFHTTPLEEPVKPENISPSAPFQEISRGQVPARVNADTLPEFQVTVTGETAPGNLFLAPTQFFTADGFLLMTNDNGDVLYEEYVNGKVPFDFKLQPNGLLSYGLMYEYIPFVGGGPTDFYIMDSTVSVIDEFQMGNGYLADFHDFIYMPNGHAVLFGYDFQPVDMSEVIEGGRPDALVAGSIIQELDIDKNVIFQWRSWDYYNIADSYNDLKQKNFDAIHINSVEVGEDGNLIVSALALGEITKINRQTGEIMWRLGGKNNQFKFLNESEEYELYFMFQHDVRCLDNGHITLFDNGSQEYERTYSRAVEYALDETAMTATKVWEYRHSPDIFVPTMGNVQRLQNGNTLIGWGFASLRDGLLATEVDPSGRTVMEMNTEPGFGSYRVFRFPWDGGKPAHEVIVYELQEGNTYSFNNAHDSTGLTIWIIEKPEFGYNEMWIDMYLYGPIEPRFPEQAPMVLPIRCVIDRFAINTIRMELAFDTGFLGLENPEQITVYHREFEGRGMFFPLSTTFNPVTHELKAITRKFGEFIFAYPAEAAEMQPPILSVPREDAEMNQALPVRLTWSPQGYANYYELEVALDSLYENDVVHEEYITEAVYTLSTVNANSVYYWRVRCSTDTDTSAWTQSRFETLPAFLRVTVPEQGSSWKAGIKHFIEWEDNIDEDVVLRLFRNDTLLQDIATVQSIGAYYWDVPFDLDLVSGYRIQIQSSSDNSLQATSGIFSLSDSDSIPGPPVTAYQLCYPRPNPVQSSAVIPYDLPKESRVRIELFNVRGQRVAVLVDGWIGKGRKETPPLSGALASGVYFYTMTATPLDGSSGSFHQTRKLVIIR